MSNPTRRWTRAPRAPGRLRPVLYLVILSLLASAVPATLGSLDGAISGASGGSGNAPRSPGAASGPGPHLDAAITCGNFEPAFYEVGNVYPLTPYIEQQVCSPLSMDEVHGSLASSVPGSGSHWTIPIYLPDLASEGTYLAYNDAYVGMVVTGDASSFGGTSYLEVAFDPSTTGPTGSYTVSVGVLSLLSAPTGTCSGVLMTFSNQSAETEGWYCEINDVEDGAGLSGTAPIPGDSWVNASFSGVVGGTTGLSLWVNDSSDPSVNTAMTLNISTTDTYAFEPAYSAACPDSCYVGWTYPFGLGVGIDMCPDQEVGPSQNVGPQPCNSYNQTRWEDYPPIEFGVPRFFEDGSYSGQYLYLSTESSSGACSPEEGSFAVANCYNEFFAGEGQGYYPFFTLNGTGLDFGGRYPWTLAAFGESAGQFEATGLQQDILPLVVPSIDNSSRAGYLPPSTPLQVSAEVVAWGSLTSVNLSYSIDGVSAPNLTMTEGPDGSGEFNATIPATGGNGTIRYEVVARDAAGGTDASAAATVVRGPLPTFHLNLTVRPAACGNVTVNGTAYPNASVAFAVPGDYALSTSACYPYQFRSWSASGGAEIVSPANRTTSVALSNNGSVAAAWAWIRPHVVVTVATSPTTCGSVLLNGSTYADGDRATLLFGVPVDVGLSAACSGYQFSGWTLSEGAGADNLSVLGSAFTPGSNGTLTANFIPAGSGSTLTFATTPAACGGIDFRGAAYVTGQSLYVSASPYPIAPAPCVHWGFENWSTTGGASVASGNVTVTSSGTLTEQNRLQTWIQVETYPTGCGSISIDGTEYSNGEIDVVANNSVHQVIASPCTGYHLVNITGTGGLRVEGDLVNATDGGGELNVVFTPGPDVVFLGFSTDPSGCGSIVFAGTSYVDADFLQVAPGTNGSIQAVPCAHYGFVGWSIESVESGGIGIARGAGLGTGTAYVNASGAITAVFAPEVGVFLYTDPSTCGEIRVGSTDYPGNTSIVLTATVAYPLGVVACPGMTFQGWQASAAASVANGTLVVTENSLLTADFAPTVYALTVVVEPATCDSITVAGRVAGNDSVFSLLAGTYSLAADACPGQELVGYNLTGAAELTASGVELQGNATLVADFSWVPPNLTFTVPPTADNGASVDLSVVVAVLVPPYDYAYTWQFGDGSAAVTTGANFTTHTFPGPGTYTVSVLVRDPLNRTAEANASIQILPATNGWDLGVEWLPLGLALAGVGAAIAVALFLAGRSRRDRPPRAPEARAAEGEGPTGSTSSGTAEPPPEPSEEDEGL